MKVIDFSPDKSAMLASIDELRDAIEQGEVLNFAAVGVHADDAISVFHGSTGQKSTTQLCGAVAQLFLRFNDWCSG